MRRILIISSLLMGIIACTSNDESINVTEENGGFYALKVGNKWVYKNYKLESNDQYIDTGVTDSIEIIAKEAINNITYFKFRRKTTGNENGITFCNPNGVHYELLRDSLGYLIKPDGTIKYANNDYSERIVVNQDWGGAIYEELQSDTEMITVEAGVYECVNTYRYMKDINNQQLAGLDRIYYADGIGLIMDTVSFASSTPHIIERRLYSYELD